jgi:hypothetical protein
MKCSLCGFQFNEQDAQACCNGCGLMKKCELVKCPNCGFEMAPEPGWIKKLKSIRNKRNETRRQS